MDASSALNGEIAYLKSVGQVTSTVDNIVQNNLYLDKEVALFENPEDIDRQERLV